MSLTFLVPRPLGHEASWILADKAVPCRLLVEAETFGSSSLAPLFAGEKSEALEGSPSPLGWCVGDVGDGPGPSPAPGTRASTALRELDCARNCCGEWIRRGLLWSRARDPVFPTGF